MVDIAIVNVSRVVSQKQLQSWMPAFQTFITDHLKPAWGVDATLHLVAKGQKADPAMWWFIFGNKSSQQGALGYHALQPNGMPYTFIAAADDIKYGASVTVTATHEFGEMLVDPELNRDVQVGPRTYPIEISDPVEADNRALKITTGGVTVLCSDFCLQSYFDPNSTEGPYDAQGILTGNISVPALDQGGYIDYTQNGIVHMINARLANGELGYRALRSGRRTRRAKALLGVA